MKRYYRPGIGWWPSEPPATPVTGGRAEWTPNLLLDWTTGRLHVKEGTERIEKLEGGLLKSTKAKQTVVPGLRTRGLQSSSGRVYHEGGPYNGAKLRKVTLHRGKEKRQEQILPDEYAVPPFSGRYVYDRSEDKYRWHYSIA